MQGLKATPTACWRLAWPAKRRTHRDARRSHSFTQPPSESAAEEANSSYASRWVGPRVNYRDVKGCIRGVIGVAGVG
jgi:hypothetical protein